MNLRAPFLSIALAAALASASGPLAWGTQAMPPVLGATELYQNDPGTGIALGGYDPVTYHLPGGPQPGFPDHEVLWAGTGWRFRSQANKAAFETNPAAFAPRCGGYDAEAASRGRVVDARPELYAIRDGRLYLFRNDANRARFLADESVASRAEGAWSRLRGGLVQP